VAWLESSSRVIVMDVKTGKRTRLAPPKGVGKVTGMVLSADDRLYVAGGRNAVAVIRLPSSK
jgi:hypothetical protein